MPAATTQAVLNHHGKCPECGTNWDGGSIFDILRLQDWCKHMSDAELQADIDQCYGIDQPQRFSRLVGVSCVARDRVVAWRCPDCDHEWPRN